MRKPVLLLLIGSALISCKKEEQPAISFDLLTGKVWKVAGVDKNTSTNPPGTIRYGVLFDCLKDNTFLFKSDNSLIINNGDVKCSSSEVKEETSEYTIHKATNSITMGSASYYIAEISESQLKLYLVSGSQNTVYIYEH